MPGRSESIVMSSGITSHAEGTNACGQGGLEKAVCLLRCAIEVLDAHGAPPELAACVQDALDRTTAFTGTQPLI